MRDLAKTVRTSLAATAATTLVLLPVSAAVAGGSDAPVPYDVSPDGLTLPAGNTFGDNEHVNIRYTVDGVEKSAGVHFESLNNQPSGQFIGQDFLPWSYLIDDDDYCITWVQVSVFDEHFQVSVFDEHFGEGGQDPVCTTDPEPEPTPEPTEPTPTPEPTPEPTPFPEPEPSPLPTDPVTPTPEPTDPVTPTPDPTDPTPTPSVPVTPTPDPTDPVTPTDPTDPVTPTVPTDPTVPGTDGSTTVVDTDDPAGSPSAGSTATRDTQGAAAQEQEQVVDRLPWTGSTALPLGVAAGGLVLVGGIVLLVRRRLTR
jgi:hypothetical protein